MTPKLDELLGFEPKHLAWPIPWNLVDTLGVDRAIPYLERRKERIIEAKADPLKHGYEPEIWQVVKDNIADLRAKHPEGVIKIIIWGGHRSSKTRFASNYVNTDVAAHPGRRWWCCDSTEAQARANQMRLINEQFPNEWRDLPRDAVTDLRYSISDGYPKNKLVCPNASEIDFKFYTMDLANLPGPELDGIWCFTAGTRITLLGGDLEIEKVKVGDLVLTRNGYRRVAGVGSRIANVGQVGFSNGRSLIGTADHPVLTTAYGWTKLSDLKRANEVCVLSAWNGQELSGTHTGEDITSAEVPNVPNLAKCYIARFTKRVTEAFQKVITFITRTEIGSIIPSTILNACRAPSTCFSISNSGASCLRDGAKPQRPGFSVRFAEPRYGESSKQLNQNVSRACTGKPKNEENLFGAAESAARNSGLGLEISVASVVQIWEDAGKARVYNITVEDTPEYFANGTLVHNCDELVPLPWVKFAVFRLVNRNGILMMTFTPEFGWNETYGYFYEGAQVISEVEAPLLPKFDEDGRQIGFKKVPRVLQCQDPLARIIYFHTADNPFGNYPVMVQELKGKHEDEIAIRAYGVCTKAHRAAFPLFNERVHTITTAQFSDIVDEHPKTMRFHLVDPCDGRNWFMIWVACPYPDKWIIYREWPSYGHPKAYIEGVGMPGPWAVSGAAADGVRGPAQDGWGFSLSAYRDEILRVEAGEQIDGRYIDSRYSTQRRTEHERITTLQEQITEVGMDFMCMVPGKGRIVGGEGNDGSVDLINSALYYDVETDIGKYSPKLAKLNEPQLLVLDTCPNVIYALEHWTGQDGQKGATKDPIDCIRGAFLTSVNYVPENMYSFQGGGVP